MRGSFSDWITRPRQILGLFAITLAVAALSASHKLHRCHQSKGLNRQRFNMRHHKVARLIDNSVQLPPPDTKLFEDSTKIILSEEEASQISDELISKASEEDIEEEMAEEVGMQVFEGEHLQTEDSTRGAQPVSEKPKKKKEGRSTGDSDLQPGGEVADDEEEEILEILAKEEAPGEKKRAEATPEAPSEPKPSKHSKDSSPKHSKEDFCPAIHEREGECDLKSTPEALHKHFRGEFTGGLILTSDSLKDKTVIAVSSPGKSRKTKLTEVTSHLLDLIPKQDNIFGRNFSRCAVIGSSGILLKYEHGKEIDKHDMVLRFNSARTKGFEKHVGAKTTHRLTNSRNFGFRENKSEHVLVHLRTPGAMKALIQRLNHKNKSVLYGLNPAWYAYMDSNLKFLSTSGLNGIIMALHRCQHVRLYGFHVHPRHGVPYHYYNVKDKPANVGRDDNEWLVVKHLIENKFVELGEPCILECNEDESECQKCIKENQ